jgi:hypothetical protein
MIAVLVAGVILAVFGGVVLIRFPDRPGGRMVVRGMEVSSVGAGFPLIVIGAVMVSVSAYGIPTDDVRPETAAVTATTSLPSTTVTGTPSPGSTPTTIPRPGGGGAGSGGGGGGNPSTSTGPRLPTSTRSGLTTTPSVTPTSAVSNCTGAYFSGIPQDRIARIEAGPTAFDVLGSHQPKEVPVGLELTVSGGRIGGMRFQWVAATRVFKIQSVVDAGCVPVDNFSNPARPGARPSEVPDCQGLEIPLAGARYRLRLCERTSTIRVLFQQAT